ncbi:MAG: serine/threonine-protein kinase, partial [Planctomycetota bacterium]
MVSAESVRRCFDSLAEARRNGLTKSLEEVLAEEEVLTDSQIETLVHVMQQETKDTTRIVGGYRLICRIGEGGMGVVYRARQLALDRQVALKVLAKRYASDAQFIQRLGREARMAAKLAHPNIVSAIDFGQTKGSYYFAMELVSGESLADRLEKRGTLSEDEALDIAMQVARGLQCAWRSGMVHRDIKPGNILIARGGVAKIADFGLARPAEPASKGGITKAGSIMGTPDYISPEQVDGKEVDVRADIYALGVTLYETVTGELPHKGNDLLMLLRARSEERPPPAHEVNPQVSEEFSGVVATMMAVDPEHRYPDPTVLLADLELVAEGRLPQYAISGGSTRKRVAETARLQQAPKPTVAIPFLLRKRRARRGIMTAAALVSLALVVLIAAWLVGSGSSTAPPADAKLAELERESTGLYKELLQEFEAGRYDSILERIDGAAGAYDGTSRSGDLAALRAQTVRKLEDIGRRALEDEGAGFYRRLMPAFEAGEYAKVLGEIDAAASRYDSTPSAGAIGALRLQAVSNLEAEAKRDKRYGDLVKQARAAIGSGDHVLAMAALMEAQGIRGTKEVADLIDGARLLRERAKLISRAKEAEGRGNSKAAIDCYEAALALAGDRELGSVRLSCAACCHVYCQVKRYSDRLLVEGCVTFQLASRGADIEVVGVERHAMCATAQALRQADEL